MNGPGLRRINHGTLPSVAYLAIVAKHEGLPLGAKGVEDLHREMQQLLRAGNNAQLRVLLERVGIEWADPLTATVTARRS